MEADCDGAEVGSFVGDCDDKHLGSVAVDVEDNYFVYMVVMSSPAFALVSVISLWRCQYVPMMSRWTLPSTSLVLR